MSQDLIPLEGYGEFADESRQSYVKMKEIRLCVELMKEARSQGMPIGHFFTFDPNVGKDESPILTDIGPSFEAIVLRDAQRVEVYDKDTKQFLVSSSEFRSNMDPVILYDRTLTDNTEEISACLPYTNKADPEKSIYHLKQTRYQNLRTKYSAYLLYEGEVYKMGFAATDNTGCEDKEFRPRGFQDASQTSFLHIKSRCHSEAGANVMFSHVLRIFAMPAFEKSVDIIKGFEIAGRVTADRKEEIDQALESLYEGLRIRFQKKTIRAYQNTLEKDKIVCIDERHIPYLVQNPRIFTQQEKLQRLPENLVVAEIEAPREQRQVVSEESVIDIAAEFEGSAPKKDLPEPPNPNVKPRNKKEAIAKKKAEREYIEESGIGEAAAAATAEVRATEEDQKKKLEDPDLAAFLEDTKSEEKPKDLPEGW
jgi:hypothetical protein